MPLFSALSFTLAFTLALILVALAIRLGRISLRLALLPSNISFVTHLRIV